MKLETYVDKAGEHRWRLRAGNGRIVADCGEGYATRHGLMRAITKLAIGMHGDGAVIKAFTTTALNYGRKEQA